jgi:hypothetical protein
MIPKLIPYYISKSELVHPVTGEKCDYYSSYYSLYDTSKDTILDNHFSDIYYIDYSFHETCTLILQNKNRKYALVENTDDLNNIIWFDYIKVISPNTIVAQKNDLFGLLDCRRSIKLYFEYQQLTPYKYLNTTYFIAKKEDKCGLVNENGKIVLPFDFDSITCNCNQGLFTASNKQNHTTLIFNIENSEKVIIPYIMAETTSISEDIAVFKTHKGHYVLYDLQNRKPLIKNVFGSATPMIDGFSLCSGNTIVYRDGTTFKFEEIKGLRRYGNILVSHSHIEENSWEINVYEKEKHISTFVFEKKEYGIFTSYVCLNKYIALGGHRMKYNTTNIQYYDLYGNKLDFSSINSLVKEFEEKNKKNDLVEEIIYNYSNLKEQNEITGEEYDELVKKNIMGEPNYFDKIRIFQLNEDLIFIEGLEYDPEFGWSVPLKKYKYKDKRMWKNIVIHNDLHLSNND